MRSIKSFRIGNKFIVFLTFLFLLTLLAWIYVQTPVDVVIKKSGPTITAEYNGKKLEKTIETQLITKGANVLTLSIKKPKEFAFVGYLLPVDKIMLNGQDAYTTRLISFAKTTYAENLLKWLDYKRDGDFSSYVNFDDVGESVEVVAQNQENNFEILVRTTGISSLSFKYDDLASVFIRPGWHHEYEMSVQGKRVFGGPMGLDPKHILKRASLLWIFGVTMTSTLLFLSALLVFCFKIFDYLFQILGKYFSKKIFLLNIKRVFNKHILFAVVALFIVSFHFFMTMDVATRTLQSLPHTQDEVSYIYQAKLLKMGKFVIDVLPNEIKPFFYHEFIIDNKVRTGIYTLGAPMFFALGMFFGLPQIVNPIASAVTLAILIYMVRKAIGQAEALIAGIFYATSFFTVMQSASFLSHAITQLFIVLTYFCYRFTKYKVFVGIALGFVFITRPYDGFLLSAFVGINEIVGIGRKFSIKKKIWAKGNIVAIQVLLDNLLAIFIGFAPFLFFQIVHNYVVSGSIFTLPINVYSPYSQIGFGQRGVEWGSEFTVSKAFENTFFYLHSSFDSFFAIGLPIFFAFFAYHFGQKNKNANLFTFDMVSIPLVFIFGYFPYYANGSFYGPRYWYGAAFAVFVLVAIGVVSLFRFFGHHFKSSIGWRVALLFCVLAIIYTNIKILGNLSIRFKDYNGIVRVEDGVYEKPSIVMVSGKNVWQSYGIYFHKMSPSLDDRVIYAIDQGISPKNPTRAYDNMILQKYFPGREIKEITNYKNTSEL